MDLDVLVFNIEYGGNASTDKVMRSLDADIIGVLESYNRLPEIAEKMGYPYYNVGLQLLSKYPIHEPSGAGGLYALVEVQPGYAVAFFNTHLDYVAYGPKLLSSGMPVQDVIASENEIRTSSMDILLPSLAETAEAGYPTFLTGDFNQPSSLDYTGETIGTREGVDKVVPWPVSEALFDIDFRDTFREVHPDPTTSTPVVPWRRWTASWSAKRRIRSSTSGSRIGPPTTVRCCRRSSWSRWPCRPPCHWTGACSRRATRSPCTTTHPAYRRRRSPSSPRAATRRRRN